MSPAYHPWIEAYMARQNYILLGKCREAVAEMRAVFPELIEKRGHVLCKWGKRGHIWLVTAEGEIVDPTADQFPLFPPLRYEEWKPGESVLVGKCMNCGDEIWRAVQTLDAEPPQESICGEACEKSYIAYLNAPHDGGY